MRRTCRPTAVGGRIAVAVVLLLSACAKHTTAGSAAGSGASGAKLSMSSDLPDADQPPDPCPLLTLAQISSVVGLDGARPGGVLATVAHWSRVCYWFAPSGQGLNLTAETSNSALAAARAMTSLAHSQPPTSTPESDLARFFATHRPPASQDVSVAVGEPAYVFPIGGQYEIDVLDRGVLFKITTATTFTLSAPQQDLVTLARDLVGAYGA
jgi:hypothetical protein